jgi:hypothetical protein
LYGQAITEVVVSLTERVSRRSQGIRALSRRIMLADDIKLDSSSSNLSRFGRTYVIS